MFLRPTMAARAHMLTVLFSCDRAQETHQPREPWSVLMTACGEFQPARGDRAHHLEASTARP